MSLATLLDRALVAAAAAVALAPPAAGAPSRVQLFPLGRTTLRDGRVFEIADAAAAQTVIANTLGYAGRMALVIDYDHQTEFGAKPGVGGKAPAAGWIETASLTVEPDGIWGEVSWTPAAAAALEAREYRYLSPMFFHAKDGRVLALKGAGLVNVPAIDQLAAVASATPETNLMDLTKIAAALGLAATATETEILAGIAAANAGAPAVAAAATQLGLAATASLADVVAAAVAKAMPRLAALSVCLEPQAYCQKP